MLKVTVNLTVFVVLSLVKTIKMTWLLIMKVDGVIKSGLIFHFNCKTELFPQCLKNSLKIPQIFLECKKTFHLHFISLIKHYILLANLS